MNTYTLEEVKQKAGGSYAEGKKRLEGKRFLITLLSGHDIISPSPHPPISPSPPLFLNRSGLTQRHYI
ncbi:MAG: hypothetical protein F6K39_00660 [Okeania sp. SIO3B3]|nr:hypothetical protein [Okeania sp. SIO3B3]